jgi:uncharacterized protein (TIGR03000 family)
MNRSRLIPAVLCLAGLFTVASLAEAAPRGGGGGARGGPAYHGGAYGGAYRGGYYHGGYFYGPGIGIGIGVYPYGYGYPYAYPPLVVGGAYSYYPPPTVVVQGQPAVEAQPQQPSPGEAAPKNAQIKVLVSDPNAKVWFDGSPTTSTGTERIYHTPDLAAGATNTYRIRAAWLVNGKEVVQEQVVPVQAGRGSVVDFTRPASEGIAPPPK